MNPFVSSTSAKTNYWETQTATQPSDMGNSNVYSKQQLLDTWTQVKTLGEAQEDLKTYYKVIHTGALGDIITVFVAYYQSGTNKLMVI